MALTVAQLEAHLGRFLRLFLTHAEPDVVARLIEPMSAALLNSGKNYVQNGNLGTLAERREAMETLAKVLYQQSQGADPNDADRGQHGFENHWLPAKQRGES
jgi:hypothetical protein